MNQGQPLVSILTLVYNHRAFIKQTAGSVLNQSFQNWEWIILDDGSTDGTGEIIKKIKDGRVYYFFQEHTGFAHLAQNYNKALTMCRGDFIALLDGDDYWPEDKLDIQVKSLDDPGAVLSYGECQVINHKGKKLYYIDLPEDTGAARNDPVGAALKKLIIDKNCFLVHPTVIVRKSAALAIGGFTEAAGIGEDFPMWVKLSLEGRFSAIPRCLGYYRKHPLSVTSTQTPINYFDNEIKFLKDFVLSNKHRLANVGFSADVDELGKRWKKLRMEAKAVHILRAFSHLLKIDLISPIISVKLKLKRLRRSYSGQ